jgi:hypothetical protein
MKDVALLNPTSPDAAATAEVITMLRAQAELADRHLILQRCASYEDYIAAFTRAETMRKMVSAAEDIYGRRFRI